MVHAHTHTHQTRTHFTPISNVTFKVNVSHTRQYNIAALGKKSPGQNVGIRSNQAENVCERSGWSKSTLKGNSYCAYFEHRFTATTTIDDGRRRREKETKRFDGAQSQTRCNDYKTQFLLFDPFEWDLHKLPCTSWAPVANGSSTDRSKKSQENEESEREREGEKKSERNKSINTLEHSSYTSLYEVRYASNWFSFHYFCFIFSFYFSTFIRCACTLPESSIQSSSNGVIFMCSTIRPVLL